MNNKKYNIIIWGTGLRTKSCLTKNYFSKNNILGFIDNNKKTDTFEGLPVYNPSELKDLIRKVDYVVILNQYYNEILKQCWELNIDLSKIVITDNIQGVFFSECFNRLKLLSEDYYNDVIIEQLRLISVNLSDRIDKSIILGKGKYTKEIKPWDYMNDYFRFRTFEFCAREIKKNNIPGSLAELGVFRGAFASLINETFTDRKLFLFDTFESFNPDEYKKELELGRVGGTNGFFNAHANTNENILLSNLPNSNICTICKGYFPQTIPENVYEEKFAFVSLDVDLEESTYQGLKFFYPRLNENGFIFLHDYTTHWLQGIKEAVNRYENDNNIILKKVPIADRGGTLIITK